MFDEYYCIQITFLDEENNGFVIIGGACWATKDKRNREWDNIIKTTEHTPYCVEKLDPDGDVTDSCFIYSVIAEELMDKPINQLIEEGRKDTQFTA